MLSVVEAPVDIAICKIKRPHLMYRGHPREESGILPFRGPASGSGLELIPSNKEDRNTVET